jgi:hypothetical protein
MKALSVLNPYPALIANSQKLYEIRSWSTKHRGPLLICSGLGRHSRYAEHSQSTEFPNAVMVKLYNWTACQYYYAPSDLIDVLGKMICVVELVDVHLFTPDMADDACCDYAPGMYAWELHKPRRVKTKDLKGRLRLFDVDDDLIEYTEPADPFLGYWRGGSKKLSV